MNYYNRFLMQPLFQYFLYVFFQAEDGIRDFCLSRVLGYVNKGQTIN